jgi:predicted transcriptional regulator
MFSLFISFALRAPNRLGTQKTILMNRTYHPQERIKANLLRWRPSNKGIGTLEVDELPYIRQLMRNYYQHLSVSQDFLRFTRGDRHAVQTNDQSRRIQKHPLDLSQIYETIYEFPRMEIIIVVSLQLTVIIHQ